MATRAPERADESGAEFFDIEISPMRRRHLRTVLRIEGEVYARPWSFSLFLSELAQRSARAYVIARSGDEIVGYAGLMFALEDAHVTTIAVDPAWHRRQVATRLLLHLTEIARQRQSRNLTLEVRVGNTAAQNLYQRFGFLPAGIRKNYYSETNEDALVMWANDVDTDEYADRMAGIAAGIRGTTSETDR